ncbi:phosphoadenosine phosphosulfate reductase family protein [Aureimonas sp. SK2]|uniref:phosphoadenosine phosphosulfate reductase domain-containing protein n=1 Tax=Aureimonas sp. SK2 TaxID=3015992 RepID=UPI002443C173|nr:phosphoadenosine phosphosulfate reductase family protein [Aureimonas sp. SK2]
MNAARAPEDIIAEAMSHRPVAIYAAMSGGDTSLATAHWMMTNVPGCRVFHANTGIGIEATREFVRRTCAKYGWPLDEIRAKEDCGQDYREMVLQYSFPGPGHHRKMYSRLKERPVRLLVKRAKQKRADKVLIATGIYHDESMVRMGYGERNINFVGSQMWVNPLYWWSKTQFMDYLRAHGVARNPVAETLGMSGECLCGAYAHRGEKALVRLACPRTADYLESLEGEVRAAGHEWGWEGKPPAGGARVARVVSPSNTDRPGMPFCRGCEKTAENAGVAA